MDEYPRDAEMSLENSKLRVCPAGHGHCLCGTLDKCPAQQRWAAENAWEPHRQEAREWLERNGLSIRPVQFY